VQYEVTPAVYSTPDHGFFGSTSLITPIFYPTTDVDAGLYIIPVPASAFYLGDSISFPQGGVYVIQFLISSEYYPTPNEIAIVGVSALYNVTILFESKNLNYASTEQLFTEVAIVHCSDDSSIVFPPYNSMPYIYGAGAWTTMDCTSFVITRLS